MENHKLQTKEESSKKAFIKNMRDLMGTDGETTENRLSFKEAGKIFHVASSAVGNWVNAKIANQPDYDTLVTIADHFDISIDWLLGRNVPKRINPDKQAVMKYLNLSESAVDALKESTEYGDDEAVNYIFDNDSFISAVDYLSRALRFARESSRDKTYKVYDGHGEDVDIFLNQKDILQSMVTRASSLLIERFVHQLEEDSKLNEERLAHNTCVKKEDKN